MKRARLERLGDPLVVRDEPVPELERELRQGIRAGGVAVKMLTSRVISYSKEVFAGRQAATLPLPFTPGAGGIGVVEKVADDVEGIERGERVLLTSYLQSNDGLGWLLLGWTGTSARLARRRLRRARHLAGELRDAAPRPRCTAVLMGGVQADVPVPYGEAMLRNLVVRGSFMHPPAAPANLVRLAASGRVPLDVFQTTAFELARVNEAIEHAAGDKGLRATVLTMG